jgi:putative phosphoesterase
MKIALLADVHANLPALEAVIDHARSRNVDEFWSLGDMVGYAPFPDETIKKLRKICSRHIVGNYDVKALNKKRIKKMRSSGKNPDKAFSFAWTNKALTKKSAAFIESLPETLSFSAGRKKILMVHGSPEAPEDELTAQTPPGRLRELARKVREDIVLCGHTHEFFQRKAGGVLFVNPGSVGRPFDGDVRASYAILQIVGTKVRVVNYRIEYDVPKLLAQMKKFRFPARLARTFVEARSLDDLKRDGSFFRKSRRGK